MKPQVKVGLSCFVRRHFGTGWKYLVGRRKGSHGAGLISVPGGGQEFGESMVTGGLREIREECGLGLNVMFSKVIDVRDLMAYLPEKQYVDVSLLFDWIDGEPETMEPEKCEGWGWEWQGNLLRPRFDLFPGVSERLKLLAL